MQHITYTTEKKINQIKKINWYNRTNEQNLAVDIWDNIFRSCGYDGATLKEFESYIGRKLDNARQDNVSYPYTGIHGIEYKTNGNVRYVGTHNLSYVNIDNFNSFVASL